MRMMKIDFGIVWENTTPSTDRDFCAGIGPLQLGVVLVFKVFGFEYRLSSSLPKGTQIW